MKEIQKVFKNQRAQNSGVLIGYLTAGDPEPKYTPKLAEALVEGGADIIELGIPFSDPIADGPTIQSASLRALNAGTTPNTVLAAAKEIKKSQCIPIVILTYYNPIFRMGLEPFFRSAKSCEVDGVIVADLPVDEGEDYRRVANIYDIDTIFLASPSTSILRLQKIVDYTSGFLYLVSRFGVTGQSQESRRSTVQLIKNFLPYTIGQIPLSVGFGISKPQDVKLLIGNGADGVIVGSAFVDIIDQNRGNTNNMLKEIKEKANELKEATTL
jgi:tryptophan synthase alpha chain